jgi:hypothetical protein
MAEGWRKLQMKLHPAYQTDYYEDDQIKKKKDGFGT